MLGVINGDMEIHPMTISELKVMFSRNIKSRVSLRNSKLCFWSTNWSWHYLTHQSHFEIHSDIFKWLPKIQNPWSKTGSGIYLLWWPGYGILGGVYMTPGRPSPQSEFTPVPSHGSIFVYMIPPQNVMPAQVTPAWAHSGSCTGARISLQYKNSQWYHVNAKQPPVSVWNWSAGRLEWIAHA